MRGDVGLPKNFIYEGRFLNRLKARIRRRHIQAPEMYITGTPAENPNHRGFRRPLYRPLVWIRTAANYFPHAVSNQFLEHIRVPTLLIQAKDDP